MIKQRHTTLALLLSLYSSSLCFFLFFIELKWKQKIVFFQMFAFECGKSLFYYTHTVIFAIFIKACYMIILSFCILFSHCKSLSFESLLQHLNRINNDIFLLFTHKKVVNNNNVWMIFCVRFSMRKIIHLKNLMRCAIMENIFEHIFNDNFE